MNHYRIENVNIMNKVVDELLGSIEKTSTGKWVLKSGKSMPKKPCQLSDKDFCDEELRQMNAEDTECKSLGDCS